MPSPALLPLAAQAAALSIVSSLLAQLLAAQRQGSSPLPLRWDPILEFALYAALTNPLNVLWQSFLERRLPGSAPVPALAKTLLDQTAGAAVNTLLFCLFVGWWEAPPSAAAAAASTATATAVAARTRRDFVPLLVASWRFWPAVSLVNFVLVRDVATRNLVGGLAGVAWGVYVALFAAA